MSSFKVIIDADGKHIKREAREGDRIHDVLTAADVHENAPCGGRGTCGKCRISVLGDAGPYAPEELLLLSAEDRERGVRLSCLARVQGDLTVQIASDTGARVLTEGIQAADCALEPAVSIQSLTLPAPTLADQQSDSERLIAAIGDAEISLYALRDLPDAMRKGSIDALIFQGARGQMIIGCGSTPQSALGVAIDVGTTTMAAYLIDLKTGETTAQRSCLNPQRAHGGDVISRVDYANAGPENADKLQSLVTGAMMELMTAIASEASASIEDIRHIVAVGNTIMMHLLANLPARHIAVLPFAPPYARGFDVNAPEIGLPLPGARITLAPCVSGYVGADTIAALLACDMDAYDGTALLIDIGTNGEIALGGAGRLLCCSAAAGPAFEGAHIACGSGAVDGAVDHVYFNEDGIGVTTIGNVPARTICGSGLVDAVAGMIGTGIVDETGRIDEDEIPGAYEKFLFELDGKPALSLDGKGDAGVYIHQKDLREVQLAKAAIAAGIDILLAEMKIGFDQVDRLYLAGGFGNFIDQESAVAIGLLPEALRGKIVPVGNAAGSGARLMLKNRNMLDRAEALRTRMEYIELSACPEFQDLFVERMFF